MMKFDIVTFGSAVIDNFVLTEIHDKGKFFSYPVGSKILIEHNEVRIGGGGINTAIAFSRLGLKTGCITCIGNDPDGKEILELMKNEKITFLGKTSNKRTGYSIILDSFGKNKDRTILTYKGPVNDISSKEIGQFSTPWIYFSSVLGKSFNAQKELIKKLKENGTKLAFNPSSYLIEHENIGPLLKMTDILIINKEEARLLLKRYSKSTDEKKILELGPKMVVITDGEKEIVCYDKGKRYLGLPKKVKIHEMTGAGDAFAAGFVSGVVSGWPIEKCLNLGMKESAAVISHNRPKRN